MITINGSNFTNFVDINEQEPNPKNVNTTIDTGVTPKEPSLENYQEKISSSSLQASFISSKLQQALTPQSNVDNQSNKTSANLPEVSKVQTMETNKAETITEESKLPQYKAATDKEPIMVNGRLMPANEAYAYYKSLVEEQVAVLTKSQIRLI